LKTKLAPKTSGRPHPQTSYRLPSVISVAATDDDLRASFSNFGATTIHLAAPGVLITSTAPDRPRGGHGPPSGYGRVSGTSMSAPGVAALAFAYRPQATVAQVKDALIRGADPVPSMAGITVSGGRLSVLGTLHQVGLTAGTSSPSPFPTAACATPGCRSS
jgi:subtilisin family serine protease